MYYNMSKSNLKKMAIAISVMLNICLTGVLIGQIKENKEYATIAEHALRANAAVYSYCDQTMDTGQMDEFLESPQGEIFWNETEFSK